MGGATAGDKGKKPKEMSQAQAGVSEVTIRASNPRILANIIPIGRPSVQGPPGSKPRSSQLKNARNTPPEEYGRRTETQRNWACTSDGACDLIRYNAQNPISPGLKIGRS